MDIEINELNGHVNLTINGMDVLLTPAEAYTLSHHLSDTARQAQQNAWYGTPQERVALGVAWLDEKCPDWRTRIDPMTLNLESPLRCVLGQVFAEERGDYTAGYYYALGVFLPDMDKMERYTWAQRHGFANTEPGVRLLREEWIAELTKS